MMKKQKKKQGNQKPATTGITQKPFNLTSMHAQLKANPKSWEEFCDQVFALLFRRLLGLVVYRGWTRVEAEDIVMIALVKALNYEKLIKLSFLVEGYFYEKVFRSMVDYSRWEKSRGRDRRIDIESEIGKILDPSSKKEQQKTDPEELKKALSDCIRKLPRDQQIIIYLKFTEKYSDEEIAKTIGKSRTTVSRKRAVAIKSLSKCLERKGYEAGDLESFSRS